MALGGSTSRAICETNQKPAHEGVRLAPIDIPVDISNAIKVPWGQIASLGAGLASLPESFRTVTATIEMPSALLPFDKFGNALDPAVLNRANDGSGMLGSYFVNGNDLAQARFERVGGAGSITMTMPVNPTLLLMSAVLMQLSQKLDAIQKAVDEVLDFMLDKDRAQLRGNLLSLQGYLNEYRFNWENDIWLANTHKETLEIKRESEQAIVHLRKQIHSQTSNHGLVEVRGAVEASLGKIVDRLKEYRLVVYTYSFASFLEPMLSGNLNKQYLSEVADSISNHGRQYRKTYSACYGAIEKRLNSSVDAVVFGNAGGILAGIGKHVQQTPLGKHTIIGEVVGGLGDGINNLSSGYSSDMKKRLIEAKTLDVKPFCSSLTSINSLYNTPHQIIADKEALYIAPIQEESEQS